MSLLFCVWDFILEIVAGEFDIVGSSLAEGSVFLVSGCKILLNACSVTLACCDDSLHVEARSAFAVDSFLCLLKLVGEDVGESGIVASALYVCKFLGSLLIVAGKEIYNTLICLGSICLRSLEILGGSLIVALSHSDNAESVEDVGVIGTEL